MEEQEAGMELGVEAVGNAELNVSESFAVLLAMSEWVVLQGLGYRAH